MVYRKTVVAFCEDERRCGIASAMSEFSFSHYAQNGYCIIAMIQKPDRSTVELIRESKRTADGQYSVHGEFMDGYKVTEIIEKYSCIIETEIKMVEHFPISIVSPVIAGNIFHSGDPNGSVTGNETVGFDISSIGNSIDL